ncbi:MAG: hypothetical protein ABR503_00455 [Chitinophagaceae bacterium]|nr:hypothetical protein [Chitinophagaceae bacterium]
MTHLVFKTLNNNLKKSIVLHTGVFLAERKKGFFRIMLYQIENFYVEVFFFKPGRRPVWFRNFKSTNKLEPYLRKIDLSFITGELCLKN